MPSLNARAPVRLATLWPALHVSFALIKLLPSIPFAYGSLSPLS
jgi:hypothetical protein